MSTVEKKTISHQLMSKGWHLFNHKIDDHSLIFLSKEFGNIRPDDNGNEIQYLKPKNKGEGIKSSFSFNFGFAEFPFHTDTAFWTKPAQYILMASHNQSKCNTLLVDINDLIDSLSNSQLSTFYNSVFALKTPHGTKFVPILSHTNSINVFRYDPNIMIPFNSSAKSTCGLLSDFLTKTEPISVSWTGNNALILNNWRFLHKRDQCNNEVTRVLKRIYINQ